LTTAVKGTDVNWNLASRPLRSQRLLVLTAVTASVALFGAVIADGVTRLLLGGLSLVFLYEVVREVRAPGTIESRTADANAPAGPWLVGMGVFVVLNASAWSVLGDRIDDGFVRFLAFGLAFAFTYAIGLIVWSGVSRLPRYQ
jgi:hypothetical protein